MSEYYWAYFGFWVIEQNLVRYSSEVKRSSDTACTKCCHPCLCEMSVYANSDVWLVAKK